MKVIAISDVNGARHNKSGFNVAELMSLTPSQFPGEEIDPEELLRLKCDVLMPAALGGVINENNAGELRYGFLFRMDSEHSGIQLANREIPNSSHDFIGGARIIGSLNARRASVSWLAHLLLKWK